MTSFWKKIGDDWCVSCVTVQQPGDTVTVTNRAGVSKTVTLGERCAGFASVFKVAPAPRAEAPQAQAVGDLSGVLALFARAKGKLKHPAIVLSVPAADTTLRLTVAGPRAKVPGSVTVCENDKAWSSYEQREVRAWLGRVLVDGTYQPSRVANGRTDAIVARLGELAREPAKVASEYGRLTGNCCFCSRPLKDERSTQVGYGATCAANYGLPWGEEKFSFKAEPVVSAFDSKPYEGADTDDNNPNLK